MTVNKGENVPNTTIELSKEDLDECVPKKYNSVEFFRVGNRARHSPISESLIVQSSIYEDNGNIRITQNAYVNYNRSGNPQYIRTGIGSKDNIEWTEWSKVAVSSDIDNTVMEFGSCTTSGNIRSVTLKKSYRRMKYFNVNYSNFNALPIREVSFQEPSTVTFKINDHTGSTLNVNLTMNYMFVGE